MRIAFRIAGVLLAAVAAVACSGDAEDTCGASGRVVECPCVGGGYGVQLCLAEGAYSVCDCGDAITESEDAADRDVHVELSEPDADADDSGIPPDGGSGSDADISTDAAASDVEVFELDGLGVDGDPPRFDPCELDEDCPGLGPCVEGECRSSLICITDLDCDRAGQCVAGRCDFSGVCVVTTGRIVPTIPLAGIDLFRTANINQPAL